MQIDIKNNSSVSFEEAEKYIHSLEFTNIINKMVNFFGWLKQDALDTCLLYKNYLILQKKYGNEFNTIPPSEDIDEFWHNHILDTDKYIYDCQQIFGFYLRHYPYLGIDGITNQNDLNKSFELTQKLYMKEFRQQIHPTRSKYPKILYNVLKMIETKFPSFL